MLRVREGNPWKKIFFSWPTVAILFVIAILITRSTYFVWLRERATAELLSERKAELADVNRRGVLIEEKLEALGTPRGIEEEVRSRFEVAKPGEKVIVIVDQNAASSGIASVGGRSIWTRVRAFLGF